MADKLPRGALRAGAEALEDAPPGQALLSEHEAARIVLEAALPVIVKAVQRDMARHVLALDELARRQDACTRNKGPFIDMRTSLRKLARGEELADVKAVREQLGDVSATQGSETRP